MEVCLIHCISILLRDRSQRIMVADTQRFEKVFDPLCTLTNVILSVDENLTRELT